MLQPKPLKNLNGQICQICGDTVGLTANGDVFVACNECAFPVCRPCYEYERKDGNQSCPQCKSRYKRHKGQLIRRWFCQCPISLCGLHISDEVNVVFLSQVVLELMEMMMRMRLMTWRMSSIMPREPALQGDNGREKIQIFLLLLDMNLNIQSLF